MSWINSNATYKQNSKNDLSFYHGFSKTPVEPTSTGTAATTLANASTKGGHTVIGTEVWAEEIPWFGLVASRAAAVTRLSGLTKLNDLVKVDGEGGKVYKYIGADDATFTEDTWADFWEEVTLTNGMTLNNRHKQPVLRYYLNQPMQTLTTTNNASIDSKGYATRLFVNESDHTGQTSGGAVVSQFAAGTDNIKNGIPSVELNPKLYLETTEQIAGTNYYDYNVSGTILWNKAVTSSSPKISCFRYIGKTVTGQFATVESTISTHARDISDIKLALGLEDNPEDPNASSVTERVETVEDVVRVLLGLSDSDAISATESISTTANTAATSAITTALADGGSIAQAIATAKEQAIANAKVTLTAGNGITIPNSGEQDTAFTVSVDTNVIATKTSVDELAGTVSGVSQTVASIQAELSTGSIATAIQTAQDTADSKVASVTGPATGLVTVTGDKDVTITVSDTIATKDYADTAAANAVTTGLATDGNIAQAIATAKSGAEQTAAAALSTARGEITTEISTAVSGLETKLTTGEDSLGAKVTALEGSVSEITTTTIPSAITTAKTETLGTTITTATGKDDETAPKVTVELSGTVQTPQLTVTTDDIASAQALAALETKVDNFHKAGVSYQVLQSLPTASATYNGVVVLVPASTDDDPTAVAGDYVEHLCVNKGTEDAPVWDWERIGTTKADLTQYAKSADLNVTETTVNGLTYSQTNGVVSVSVEEASTSQVGTVKLDNTIADSTSETTAATPKAVKEYADTKVGSVQYFGENDLLSSKAEIVDGKLVISEQEVTYDGEINNCNSYNEAITKVKNNECFIGNEKYSTVEFDKMEIQLYMFYNSSLSEFYSDLSSLTYGRSMFADTQLTQFVGDLPSLTYGFCMFHYCPNLTTFTSDLSSLTSGEQMFHYCSNLTTFTSDLSSLTNGVGMFSTTNLSLESVECIADTINDLDDDTRDESYYSWGRITISWSTLPDEDKRQALVDELSRIVDKGWTLETNKQLLPLFDSEKYKTGYSEVQPLDLESEPQTVYYVVKK